MERHFFKKKLFTILFLPLLAVFSLLNFYTEMDYIAEAFRTGISQEGRSASELVNSIDTAMNENIFGKYFFIELNGLAEAAIGQEQENAFSFIKAEDGELFYADTGTDYDGLDKTLNRIQRICSYTEKVGIPAFVILAPDKAVEGNIDFSSGLPYDDDIEAEEYCISYFDENDINYLNYSDHVKELREISGTKELFYRTDHHWKIETGFAAFCILSDYMEKVYGEELDPNDFYTDISNYNIYNYKEIFLGSMGRKTGVIYAEGLEDFSLIIPNFETDFTHNYIANNTSRPVISSGTFMEALLMLNYLQKDNIYKTDRYSTYMNGVNLQDQIVNNDIPNGIHVLMIRDSSMAPSAAFLSLECGKLDLIYNLNYDGNIYELIDEGDYDYVILECWTHNLGNEDFLKCIE